MSKIIGIRQDTLSPWLKERLAKLKNTAPLMKIIAGDLEDAVQKNFETQGARLPGGAWEPLKPSTIKRKKGNKNILIHKGVLRKGIQRSYNNTEAAVGVPPSIMADEHPEVHQFGASINIPPRERIINLVRRRNGQVRFAKKKKAKFAQKVMGRGYTINIPQRQFLGLNEDDVNQIKLDIYHFVLE